MLRFMRKYAAGWMIKIIFGLIILVFIFWGVGGPQGEGEKTVAEVGAHKITRMEYEEAYNRLVDMYRNIFKEKFDEKLMKTLKLREAAMNDLVDRYLLIQKARELGLSVSDKEFRDRLETEEAFKKDGKFNKQVYQEVLKMNKMEPGKFEQSQKMAMLSGKMVSLIRDNGAVLNDAQVYNAYVKEKGKVDLAYMVFDPSDYMKKVTVTDKEVEDAYEKEKSSHVSQNRYRLKYITVIDKGPVKDDDAYMELLKTKDIDRYGKEKGFTVTDMGSLTEQEVLQKLKALKANEWLKGLKKGDVSLPIRADGKSFIFELVEFEAGKPIEKATVLKEIRERITREKAKAMAKAEAQAVITSKSFSSKKETGFLARNAGSIPSIGAIPGEDRGVMTLSKGHELYDKPVDIGGKYYLFSLKEEKAPDKEEWEKDKGPFKQYMTRKNEDEFFKSFMEDLKKSSKVSIKWKEITADRSEG